MSNIHGMGDYQNGRDNRNMGPNNGRDGGGGGGGQPPDFMSALF